LHESTVQGRRLNSKELRLQVFHVLKMRPYQLTFDAKITDKLRYKIIDYINTELT